MPFEKSTHWIPVPAKGRNRRIVCIPFQCAKVLRNLITMAIRRIRPSWIIGGLFGLTFVVLLTLRLDILQQGKADHKVEGINNDQIQWDRETWMNIFQKDQKIGYAHRQFSHSAQGFKVLESVFMQINTMGMMQEIRFRTEGNLHPDLTLSSFDFELQSSLFRFKAQGVLKDQLLSILAGTPGSEQKVDLPIKKDANLSVGVLEALVNKDLKSGETRTFNVFDPVAMAERPVKVSVLGEETISIMGRQEKAVKVSVDFMGAPQFAWIGKDRTVLREEGSFGIRLEQVTREEALQKVALLPDADITEITSIRANKTLDDVDGIKELNVKLEGIEEGILFLNGGRQSFKDKVLMIRKEVVSSLLSQKPGEGTFQEGKSYLEGDPFIQSDHPEIKAKMREIVLPDDPALVKAKKLVSWVYQNIQKRPVLSVPNALETLHNRVGDCNEHAVLLTALARAAGIPAQVEAGLVYQKGRFYYHAWNVLYLGDWITADSVRGQLPSDVTHIRFVRGNERQIDLIGIIGKVKLEILSTS